LHPHSNVGGDIATFALTLALALCLFFIVRLLSTFSLMKAFLRSVAGFASVAALPVCWLYTNYVQWHLSRIPLAPGVHGPALPWPLVELAVVLLSILIYLWARWPFPAWASVALIVLHWAFWGWRFFARGTFSYPGIVFPLIGLGSTLAWAMYVSQQRTETHRLAPAQQATS
jgi:hypothetical protein